MCSVRQLFIFMSFPVCLLLAKWRHPDENLSITQFITKYGYPVETHRIETEDGYILTTQRIPHGKASNKPNQLVILLVHGMGGSAENFITLGANDGLAFLLADRGFDVWLFNARGTLHSRKHKFKSSNNFQGRDYWDFSFHEIGIYDLSANIDYILAKTNKSNLFYVGHSQGCTSYFILTSERPEYNSKIKFAVMLAPALAMGYVGNVPLKIASKFHPLIEAFVNMLGYHELTIPNSPLFNSILKTICGASEEFFEACIDLYNLIGGEESGLLNKEFPNLEDIQTSVGQSISCHQYGTGYFRKYDFGVRGNLMEYNSEVPPLYNLNNSEAPVAVFFGDGDFLASKSAKGYIQEKIPNIFTIYEIPYDKFNHLDFMFAYNAKEMAYEPLYNLIMNFVK